jgi:hypothetical protein
MKIKCGNCNEIFQAKEEYRRYAFFIAECPYCQKKNKIIQLKAKVETSKMGNPRESKNRVEETGKIGKQNAQSWDGPLFYLCIKTEGVEEKIFELNEGEFLIGRVSQTKRSPDIDLSDLKLNSNFNKESFPGIENHISECTSRHHCFIKCKQNEHGEIAFTLKECKALNHTFYDQSELITDDIIIIEENKVIQAGYVKFFIKKGGQKTTRQKVSDFTSRIDYTKTMRIDL